MLQHQEVWQPSRSCTYSAIDRTAEGEGGEIPAARGAAILPMSVGWWPDTDELLAVFELGDLVLPGLEHFAAWHDDHLEVGFTKGLSVVRRHNKIAVTVSGVRWGRYPLQARSAWHTADSCLVGAARGISKHAGIPDIAAFIDRILAGCGWVGAAGIR